jgi:ATP-dependent protease Clp ATPase subunit
MSVLHIDQIRRCDFCGSTEREVAFLVESPDYKTHICDECVKACAEIIEKASAGVERRSE